MDKVFRFLGLGDEYLKKYSKMYGVLGVILGSSFLTVSIFFYFVGSYFLQDTINVMTSISADLISYINDQNNNIPSLESASTLLKITSDAIKDFALLGTIILFSFGTLILAQGIIYLKINQILKKQT